MSVNTTVSISGMHCGHCVSSVTEELQELEGVQDVSVDLNKGGVSVVTITSASELDPEEISEAVAEAGYTVAGGA
ncbi:heavy-metal-associated domain-containing protein [Arthrobacter sp. H-02-3]|uniref:heavy-metal-associated domain-containing protein n=1 Tax=Arthrobacter sp. H-02-3 TaxID=2703675 RepID=UPI000DD24F6E|nr:heavy-metal-associated domain-containing protein [Arthrobacter sp. H-02-3]PVZ60889.1 heavy metal transporter [Arthrobacter sp. H-02-3]